MLTLYGLEDAHTAVADRIFLAAICLAVDAMYGAVGRKSSIEPTATTCSLAQQVVFRCNN